MNNFQNWKAPKWHKDFGSPKKELKILIKGCHLMSFFNKKFIYNLDCYEEGYMRVIIKKNQKTWGELVVTDVSIKKLGVFNKKGNEKYFKL